MKKYFYLAAVSAMMLTACSSENDVVQPTPEPSTPTVVAQQQAVGFDVYLASATASTRADAWIGKAGVMTSTSLKDTEANGGGFGVFATYSDGTDAGGVGAYSANKAPNFMYNQKVLWDNTSLGWKYEPLKYWPNETEKDSQGATMGTRVDKLTFFAYAPYVASSATAANAATGELAGVTYTSGAPATDQYGIIKITANNATTDPKVTYRVSKDPSKTVDLLWGVAPAGGLSYETVNPTYGSASPASPILTVAEGMPLIDLIKPNKDQKMKFLFKHALSRLNFTVVGAFDQIAPGGRKDDNTKVLVEKVEVFEGTTGSIKTDGVLNLNNTAAGVANWDVTSTAGDYTSTALFSVSGSAITASILDGGDKAFSGQPAGVTTAETPLFADATKFFAVIPNASTQFVFEITYYVQTQDTALAPSGTDNVVDGSRVKNVVRVPVTIDLVNNKSYNFRLILGLTSVKLVAEVADWELAGDIDANLPRNNQ